jgi:hypothetical protein
MKASTQYNDLVGTAAADISYGFLQSNLNAIANAYNLDQNRFTLVGLHLYGVNPPRLSLICVDNERSEEGNEHIVKMAIDDDRNDILSFLFERLNIVLYPRFDRTYPSLDYNEEAMFSDFHEEEE